MVALEIGSLLTTIETRFLKARERGVRCSRCLLDGLLETTTLREPGVLNHICWQPSFASRGNPGGVRRIKSSFATPLNRTLGGLDPLRLV